MFSPDFFQLTFKLFPTDMHQSELFHVNSSKSTLATANSPFPVTGLLYDEDLGLMAAPIQIASWPILKSFTRLSPPPTKYLLEIGANSRNILQDEMRVELDDGAVLLTFEPLLDKYAHILTRFGGTPDNHRAVGFQHSRGMVFPLAVGCKGFTVFNVAQIDGCSSLLSGRGPNMKQEGASDIAINQVVIDNCATMSEKRKVPCVSLEEIVGVWLEGNDIAFLKVDGQGFDLEIVRSAGLHANKLKKVLVEAQCDLVELIYAEAPNCSSIIAGFEQMGFSTTFNKELCKTCPRDIFSGSTAETDITFVRA